MAGPPHAGGLDLPGGLGAPGRAGGSWWEKEIRAALVPPQPLPARRLEGRIEGCMDVC